MEKRFSLEKIITGINDVITRFPLAMLIALVGTCVGLLFIHNEKSELLVHALTALLLAFPLFISATLFSEQTDEKSEKMYAFSLATIIPALYFVFLRTGYFTFGTDTQTIQYMLWSGAATLSMTFAPFIRKGVTSNSQFWNYNKKIVYAYILTGFYSVALYLGLAIALQSVNFLFDLDIMGIRWAELWVITVGIVSSLMFLSRYPKVQAYEAEVEYPKELRLFSYYILAPLVSLYFIILYSYTIKILLSQEWPKGIISYMILGFSTLGILTYVTLFPLIQKEARLERIGKIFFAFLIPQALVLLFAVWLRINEYGITENRYLLVVFGLWLAYISLYFILSKIKKLSVIPVSLFIILIAISFGPWGMFSVSKNSQMNRLTTILERNELLVDGKVVDDVAIVSKGVSDGDAKQIHEILLYLQKGGNLESIKGWFDEDITGLSSTEVAELLGMKDVVPDMGEDMISIEADTTIYKSGLMTKGYDYIGGANGVNTEFTRTISGVTYRFVFDNDVPEYKVYKGNTLMATMPLSEFFDTLSKKYYGEGKVMFASKELPVEDLSVTFENASIKMKVYFVAVSGREENRYTNQIILFTVK